MRIRGVLQGLEILPPTGSDKINIDRLLLKDGFCVSEEDKVKNEWLTLGVTAF